MPYKRPGTWEGKPYYRWKKMVKGKIIRIRCADELHLPPEEWTELGSIKAASEWLDKNLSNLPDNPARVERLAEDLANLEAGIAEKLLPIFVNKARQDALDQLETENPEVMATYSHLIEEKFRERFDGIKNRIGQGEKVETNFTLKHHAARFLAIERAKSNRPRTYGELKESIDAMIETDGMLMGGMDVRTISRTTVENYYLWLRKTGRADGQQKKQWGFFKRLIRYLWEAELIELPRNLDSNSFRFKVTASKIKEYSPADIKAALANLSDRLKLYAMLALNCGMLNVDMGNLLKIEVDLKAGRITRKRVKTSEEKDVPEVDYKLWPITLKLLRAGYSKHPTLALTSKTGTKLHEHWIGEDGEEHEKDLIGQQWKLGTIDEMGNKLQGVIPLKAFRSIGSTIIGKHRDYGRYAGHYLGHSPKTIADKHYVAPSRELFDEILAWLWKELGLAVK